MLCFVLYQIFNATKHKQLEQHYSNHKNILILGSEFGQPACFAEAKKEASHCVIIEPNILFA